MKIEGLITGAADDEDEVSNLKHELKDEKSSSPAPAAQDSEVFGSDEMDGAGVISKKPRPERREVILVTV